MYRIAGMFGSRNFGELSMILQNLAYKINGIYILTAEIYPFAKVFFANFVIYQTLTLRNIPLYVRYVAMYVELLCTY